MVEVVAETALGDGGSKVGVGGAQDPDVGRLSARAAEATHGAVLDGGEQLGLDGRGEEGDLVEEKDAAVSGVEESGLGVAGVGERAAREAEELGLEKRQGQGGAVDVHERGVAARADAMKEASREALAGAGVALEEDGRQSLAGAGAVEEAAQGIADGDDGGTLAEELSELVEHGRVPASSSCDRDHEVVISRRSSSACWR